MIDFKQKGIFYPTFYYYYYIVFEITSGNIYYKLCFKMFDFQLQYVDFLFSGEHVSKICGTL